MSRKSWLLPIAALLCCASCVTTSVNEQFEVVELGVADRTGYNVEFIGISAGADPVAQYTSELMADSLTADEAVQVALLNNRELQASFAEMGVEVGQYIQAGLLPNPVADIEFRLWSDQEVVEGTLVEDFLEIILIPFRKRLQGAQMRAAQNRIVGEVINLAAETRIAYWEFVGARQHYVLAQDVLMSTAASYAMAWRLRRAGNVQLLLLQLERARREQARLDVAEAEMRLIEARERLNSLMGMWGLGTTWQTPDRLPPVPEVELDLNHIEQRAIMASLDLPQALFGISAAARELGIRRVTTFIPELKAGMAVEREPSSELELVKREFQNQTEYALREKDTGHIWWNGPMLSIEIPIFDQKQGLRTSAQMEIRRRWELMTDLAIDIRAAARLAAYRLEYTRKRALFLEQVVVPVRHAITLQTHLQYNAMFLGIFQLLRQKEQEINAARDYITTLCDYWTARTQVEQLLMGRLYDTNQPRMGHGGGDRGMGLRAGMGAFGGPAGPGGGGH